MALVPFCGPVVVVGRCADLPLGFWCSAPGSRRTRPRGVRGRSALDGDAHRTGGALDDLHRGLDVVGVEVGLLGLGDLPDLVTGEPTDLLLVRDARALLEAGGL